VDWIHPWIGLDWIGLDWVEILEKNDGMGWIGSKVLYIKNFTAIFVRPIIYRYSIFLQVRHNPNGTSHQLAEQ